MRGGQDPQWGPFLGKRVARVPRSTQDPGPVSSLFLTSGLPQPGPHGVCRRPPRLPRETLTFREELDILKFLCKDLWVAVFHKQMDSLRTNHQVGAPQADSRQRPEPWEPREGTPAQGSHSRPSPPWGLPTSTPSPPPQDRPLAAGGRASPDAACLHPNLVPIRRPRWAQLVARWPGLYLLPTRHLGSRAAGTWRGGSQALVGGPMGPRTAPKDSPRLTAAVLREGSFWTSGWQLWALASPHPPHHEGTSATPAPWDPPLSPGDLCPAGQQLPPPCPDGLGSAVPGGSAQGTRRDSGLG